MKIKVSHPDPAVPIRGRAVVIVEADVLPLIGDALDLNKRPMIVHDRHFKITEGILEGRLTLR
jgi:hypothetical protein